MSFVSDFKGFVAQGNVVDLAVAVVIGGAFTKIVNALVEGLINPLIAMIFKADDLAKFMVGPFKVGALIGATIDFLLIALVVYVVFVRGLKKVVPDTSKPA